MPWLAYFRTKRRARVEARRTRFILAVLSLIACWVPSVARGDDFEPPPPAGQSSAESGRVAVELKQEVSGYADTDAVSVFTPALEATLRDPLAGWSATGSYLVDVVSAASVDIVSTASEHWTEVRHVGALSAEYSPSEVKLGVSGSVSSEPDYLSLSGGGTLSLELADKTVTPIVGYSYTHDTSGRTGTPFSVYSLELVRHSAQAGLELILDPSTLVTLVADAMFESGRQEKPYRFVPLFSPDVVGRVPAGASVAQVNALRLPGRVAEHDPDSRNRFAVAARLAQRLAGSTFVITERVYGDDWGLKASTTDLRILMDASRRVFIWTHLRGHIQSGVSFWQRAYSAQAVTDGVEVPALRTGDRELGPLWSGTFGGGLRWLIGRDTRPDAWSLLLQSEVSTTSFRDTLFIQNRQAFFNSLEVEAKF